MHKAPFGGKKKGPSGTGVTSADGTTIRPADAPKATRKKKAPPTLTATLTADLMKYQPGLVLSRLPKVKEGAGIPTGDIRRPEDVPLRRRGEECIQAKHIGMAKEALHARQTAAARARAQAEASKSGAEGTSSDTAKAAPAHMTMYRSQRELSVDSSDESPMRTSPTGSAKARQDAILTADLTVSPSEVASAQAPSEEDSDADILMASPHIALSSGEEEQETEEDLPSGASTARSRVRPRSPSAEYGGCDFDFGHLHGIKEAIFRHARPLVASELIPELSQQFAGRSVEQLTRLVQAMLLGMQLASSISDSDFREAPGQASVPLAAKWSQEISKLQISIPDDDKASTRRPVTKKPRDYAESPRRLQAPERAEGVFFRSMGGRGCKLRTTAQKVYPPGAATISIPPERMSRGRGESPRLTATSASSVASSLHSQLNEVTRDLAITTPSPVPGVLSPLAAQWHTEQAVFTEARVAKGRRTRKPEETITPKNDATVSAPATISAADTAIIQDIIAPQVAGPSDPGPRDPGAVGGKDGPPEVFIPVYDSDDD